jgi:CRISPR-associated protein Csm1
MDVDKLGAIFQQGVKPASLSRVVGLSGMLRLFFEGYVPKIANEFNANGQRRIYLMYAGGDDLFVVGGWSHLPELAWQIRKALREFAAGNDKVTISAGISLALSKRYPIYQAAQDAGEAEEMAKREGRNRIAFLGQAVEWENKSPADFLSIHRRVQQIAEWLNQYNLNRSFLMRLRAIDAEMRVWQKQESVVAQARYIHDSNKRLYLGPWLWHMVYGLRRATERIQDGEAKSSVNHFIENIVPQEIEVLGLESRWAEFLTRKKNGDK